MEFVDPRTLSRHNPTPPSRDTRYGPYIACKDICGLPYTVLIHFAVFLMFAYQ